MKFAIVILVAIILLILVRRNLLQVDMSFPLFVAIVVLGFLSMSEGFLIWSASRLGIADPPMTVVLAAIAILLTLTTLLAIAFNHLRHRHLMLVRYLAQSELDRQEQRRRSNEDG